jgi:serine/threonine-protein kinase
MSTTTFFEGSATRTWGGHPSQRCSDELLGRYQKIIDEKRLSWTEHHRLIRPLGAGGQGVVYLSERRGTDSFTLPVALKIFSPERYEDERAYDDDMGRLAGVAAHVAQIQQDNLLDVHNWVDRHRIRLMEMEWVDGFDLSRLLLPKMLDYVYGRVSTRRWEYINEVIVTAGRVQPRVKPGIAIAIIRDCLAALAALHREGIVHGDIKPGNIMLKRTGNVKIVDIGSAFELTNLPPRRTCTPSYAAPEVLDGGESSPRSDLASLGYVLVEMLAGQPPFEGHTSYRDLLEAKRFLAQRLPQILPEEVVSSDLLMNFCRGPIAPDPMRRFPSAEAADLLKEGAAGFHRQLVIGNLASEYENEIRLWLEELEGFE